MSAIRRDYFALPWILGSLFLAGIVHISSVLMMPRFAEKDAFALLSVPIDGVQLLPDASDRQSIPFQDPAATLATCRFDLDKGPMLIRYNAGENLLTMSFRDRTGNVFYSTTDRAALRGKLDILLVDAQQLDNLEANDPEDQAPQELRLVPPTRTGFVLIRAIADRDGGRSAAINAARSVVCRALRG
ncbi:MAG: hypothetical protein KGM42_13310 [Hyphomicrobiales bacterium]|nr:hypothetical protein [Hyphomicrobiales bacterium]